MDLPIYDNRFNPWYVGGGVKSHFGHTSPSSAPVSILGMLEGVLKVLKPFKSPFCILVSILGMLEGVLKEGDGHLNPQVTHVSILGMLEGVLKGCEGERGVLCAGRFQSLVCWRGC